MKLLGWMHRKFRQNSSETPKEFSIGNSCTCLIGLTGQPSLEDLHCFPNQKGSHCCNKPFGRALRNRGSYSKLEATRGEDDEELGEEPSADFTEIFHGFLAIGTLGTEPIATDPATPTFSISVDHIAEKETEVTEEELKLINDELEKVLGAELKDESCYSSSARNSHASAGRISHCSTITLGGKPIEENSEMDGNETIICPLQSYLLRSAIEQQDMMKSHGLSSGLTREHRTSLGELFQRSKIEEENSGAKTGKDEKRLEKETDKSALHLVKKILKKKLMLHASSRSCTASGGTNDSAALGTKLHKIRHIFNRKVHPENPTSGHQTHMPTKNEIKDNNAYDGDDLESSDEHITIYPHRMCSSKKHSNSYQLLNSSGDETGNEFWVKTDADYLVLEL